MGRSSRQRVAYGLYAEQFTGSAFTAPRGANRRSWLYRIRPAAMHEPFEPMALASGRLVGDFASMPPPPPDQLRWNPLPLPSAGADFLDGLVTMAGNGDPHAQAGCACHVYAANRSMTNRAFYSADGELLIVLQEGRQRFVTELGVLEAEPQEIVVIPRGMRFRVELLDSVARGYVCENFGAAFKLPDRGPIGSNGLANLRDFLTPVAAYEDVEGEHELVAKFMDHLWKARMNHSPSTLWPGAVTRALQIRPPTLQRHRLDHLRPPRPDDLPGAALGERQPVVSAIDFVAFAPRVLAMQDTFRPPGFHRNLASEFMGLVHGATTPRRKVSCRKDAACTTA